MTVSQLFDDMHVDYDDMTDLWYSWIYSRLHYLIAKHVIVKRGPGRVLDVGCGTGLQSYLHAAAGASVTGIDISGKLLGAARAKARSFRPGPDLVLFPVNFDFVKKYIKGLPGS